MDIEYKQWLFITRDLKERINEIFSNDDFDKKYEFENIFDRWLIVLNQDKITEKYSNFPIIPKVIITNESDLPTSATILVNDLMDKRKLSKNEVLKACKDFFDYIAIKHEEYILESLTLDPKIENNIFYLEKFEMKKCPNLSYFVANMDKKKWKKVDIAKMLLRYESFGNRRYQWSLSKKIYDCYYREYGVRYEGFVSPFNSNLIGRDGHRFCSFFPDTDTVFGSMGSFFDVDLLEYNGSRWTVNPPFIEELLERTSDKVIQTLDADLKNTFFCTYPNWSDNIGWRKLSESKYTIGKYSDKRLRLQDAYGETINASHWVTIFCLSNEENIDLKNLEIALESLKAEG